jgi:hypothetical protein
MWTSLITRSNMSLFSRSILSAITAWFVVVTGNQTQVSLLFQVNNSKRNRNDLVHFAWQKCIPKPKLTQHAFVYTPDKQWEYKFKPYIQMDVSLLEVRNLSLQVAFIHDSTSNLVSCDNHQQHFQWLS